LDYATADLFGANEYAINGEDLPFGADNLTRMVLNPDVTVRSRGVIEKCSFCVQRIQEGKLTAKREQRKLKDQDVKTACQTACPTGAIVFGDRNDKDSMLNKRLENELNYLLLEEINVQTSVFYSAKINNRDEELDA
jgi:Fe-S-cluster-containing dehydrogenase component